MAQEIRIYKTPQAVAEAFASNLYKWLKEQKEVHIALSGGSTPKLLFSHLSTHYKNRIDWRRIHLFWGDERCVPPEHADSNYKMTRELLLQHINIPAKHIHRVRGEANPQEEARRYEQEILAHLMTKNKWPIFDLIILGMGSDGHTASIFPNQMELLHSDHICEVATHPESGQKRITLTGEVINRAKQVAFLITAEAKTEVLAEILAQTGAWETYPTSHIKPRGDLIFYLDESAAGKINRH